MKRVKNDWRSRLKSSTVSDLMCVVLHTGEVGEYDPMEAIELWYSASERPRRPETGPYGARSTGSSLGCDPGPETSKEPPEQPSDLDDPFRNLDVDSDHDSLSESDMSDIDTI